MNKKGILCSKAEQMAFDATGFKKVVKPGIYVGKLVARMWGKGRYLQCYFENESGQDFMTFAFWHSEKNSNRDYYGARDSSMNYADVETGTVWKLTFNVSSKGNVFWLLAEEVEDYGHDENMADKTDNW